MSHDPVKILAKQKSRETSYQIVYEHSVRVWRIARDMSSHLEGVDFSLLYRACLLHDVGRLYHPPQTAQAIRHGLTGADILSREGLYPEAKAAERHIGVGITAEDVLQQCLPLPVADYVPRTVLEHIVAHADNLDGKGVRDEQDVEERFARELGEAYRRRTRTFHRRVQRLLAAC
ncbi:MAG: HD domain-containing protein [Desulfohalobiaceae bacterium]